MLKIKNLLGIGLLLVLGVAVVGCGRMVTLVYYHNPSWLPNGKIICTKYVGVDEYYDMWGGIKDISKKYYLVTMDDDGGNEQEVREVTANELGEAIAASPDGRYIAVAALTSIRVLNSDFSDYSIITPEGGSIIEHLDFSPTSEGYKIVYTNQNKELRLTDIDASFNNLVTTSAEGVAWRSGEKIAYEFKEGFYYYFGRISPDGVEQETYKTMSVYSPQVSVTKPNVVYGLSSGSYAKLDTAIPSREVLIPSLGYISPRLSFSDLKIVGGELVSGSISDIYVTDLLTGVTTRLR